MVNHLLLVLKPVLALVLLALFAGLYFLAKDKDRDFAEEINRYGFKLAFLAPIGFFLAEKLPYQFNSGYDRKIRGRIAELFGQRETCTYFAVHIAQKAALMTASAFFFSITYLAGEAEYSFLVFGLILSALLYYWVDKDLEKKLKMKKRQILIELPGFINTLALLINAGLPFSSAVHKVVHDSDPDRPLYKEMNYVLADIGAGKPIHQAYEDFARRCRIPEITRFVSTIIQNLNRGNGDIVYVLRTLAQEAWEKRKDIARKQGEEASSKLVFPMVMVFIAVAIIVLAPAIMTMGR
ncbi:type II secretion system F family protein [Thermincola potens]|uniref:Type II secretion system F domain protein n=1 Tax=Thermincola potens (strain JR) TaxID=635013 RepID=D5XAS3_THEPJ|nr:type II secretion system F family protein [Thermincola potens]ADG83277.1 Type II secretion system F domain protein [Thermincola potens JR]